MKRALIILCLSVIFVFPVMAQDSFTTYEFEDTGTTIDYPDSWDAELTDQILILTAGEGRQVLVLDYSLISLFLFETPDFLAADAVAVIAEEVVSSPINEAEIYDFEIDDRVVTAYDINLGVNGSVLAIEFSNGAFGILITVEIEEAIVDEMLRSFDNNNDVVDDVAVSGSSEANLVPSAYIFQGNGRLIYPAGWIVQARLREDVQYVVLSAPNDEQATVVLFDLSEAVTSGTALVDALDEVGIEWADTFAFDIDDDSDTYTFGDREAIVYDLEVDDAEGYLVVLRFDDESIGVVAVYGDDTDDYDTDIAQLIGSFNNLGALLQFIQ